MNRHISIHRYALLVLVVCLATLAGCGRQPVDQLDLTTLLPGEPAWLMAAEIPALRHSETWRDVQGVWSGRTGPIIELDLFFEDAGIDPEQDLDRLLAGLYQDRGGTGEFSAVLTGRFNRETLLPALEGRGFAAETQREHTLVCPPAQQAAEPGDPTHFRWYVVYFDDTAIGLSDSRAGAAGMIDRLLDGGESLDLHTGFGPLLAQIDRTTPCWGAGLLSDDAVSGLTADFPMKGMIPSLPNLAFSIRLDTGMQLDVLTLLPTGEEATRLAGQLNGWVKLAAGLIQANPQWFEKEADHGGGTLTLVAETLDQVAISSMESTVRLEAVIPAELIRQAASSVAGAEAGAAADPLPLPSP